MLHSPDQLSFNRAFVVGVFYLYGLFLTGYLQLGWFNLIWIVGMPERRWGRLFLIIPGFVFEMALMVSLGIDPY